MSLIKDGGSCTRFEESGIKVGLSLKFNEMQNSSLTHSESDVKLDVSDGEATSRLSEPQTPPGDSGKRFSILGDLEELSRNLQKVAEEQQKTKKSSYSEDVFRKTLELTCEYDQTGDKILKLNLLDREEPVAQEAPPAPEKALRKQKSQRYSQEEDLPKPRQQSKQTSCQTVVMKNPRMYKQTRTINLMAEPVSRIPSDFSHELYKNSATAPLEDKENVEYNLFSKAIETERLKDKDSFWYYFKGHK